MTDTPSSDSPNPTEGFRTVTAIASLGVSTAAPGFIQGTIGGGGPVPLDPFLSITEFWMSEPIFAPHPHAGFSAVTYMFSDSEGTFVNRDSLGDRSLIGPGSLHWTQAGSGMLHEEIPQVPGVASHGMQLFVNLRARHKDIAPQAFHLDSADVPVVERDGAQVRVVLGTFEGAESPLEGLAEPIGLLEVALQSGAELRHTTGGDERVVLLVSGGSLHIGDAVVAAQHIAVLDGSSSSTLVTAGAEGASFLVLSGRPMNEPLVFGGSFVALDRAGIDTLQRRFRRGEMGELSASFTIR